MAQKLFSTGPGVFRKEEQKEAIDGLNRTSCDSLFHSEMAEIKTRRKYSECVKSQPTRPCTTVLQQHW